MDCPLFPPSGTHMEPKPPTQRNRSNSFPIVEALGCSTPEAQLILAEGRAAVRKRRARGRQNRSVNDESITVFDPREHTQYLNNPAKPTSSREDSTSPYSSIRSLHTRQASDASDHSTLTAVPNHGTNTIIITSPTSPLDNYSANLAQFIKAQLNSIPAYQPNTDPPTPLSPRSCPDFSCPVRMTSQSSQKSMRRPTEAPKIIQIPPIRPPMRSAFSAWSSTDDETDDDTPPLPHLDRYSSHVASRASNYAPSILGYYETSVNSSFLFSPEQDHEEEEPSTARAPTFPSHSMLPGSASDRHSDDRDDHDDHDYPSSGLSQPLLTSSSAPTSSPHSTAGSSYFETKRPDLVMPQLRDRIIAALTPPHGKTLTAISPWEGAAIANVHDVFVESQQRIHVDGLSFDMVRDFALPAKMPTPC